MKVPRPRTDLEQHMRTHEEGEGASFDEQPRVHSPGAAFAEGHLTGSKLHARQRQRLPST